MTAVEKIKETIPQWTTNILLAVCGFFLINVLNKIDKIADDLSTQNSRLERYEEVHKSHDKQIDDIYEWQRASDASSVKFWRDYGSVLKSK